MRAGAGGGKRTEYLLLERASAEEEDDEPEAGIKDGVGCVFDRLETKGAFGTGTVVEALVTEDQQGKGWGERKGKDFEMFGGDTDLKGKLVELEDGDVRELHILKSGERLGVNRKRSELALLSAANC